MIVIEGLFNITTFICKHITFIVKKVVILSGWRVASILHTIHWLDNNSNSDKECNLKNSLSNAWWRNKLLSTDNQSAKLLLLAKACSISISSFTILKALTLEVYTMEFFSFMRITPLQHQSSSSTLRQVDLTSTCQFVPPSLTTISRAGPQPGMFVPSFLPQLVSCTVISRATVVDRIANRKD